MTEPTPADELRRLAEAATPGDWWVLPDTNDNTYFVLVGEQGVDDDLVCMCRDGECKPAENADYIAAANPKAVLSLLDQLTQAEETIAELRGERDRMRKFLERIGNDGPWCLCCGVEEGHLPDCKLIAALQPRSESEVRG